MNEVHHLRKTPYIIVPWLKVRCMVSNVLADHLALGYIFGIPQGTNHTRSTLILLTDDEWVTDMYKKTTITFYVQQIIAKRRRFNEAMKKLESRKGKKGVVAEREKVRDEFGNMGEFSRTVFQDLG